MVETDDGAHVWIYDGQEFPNVGFNAVVGRPVDEYGFEPTRFDDMRRGAWDIHDRIKDMDLNGVYASLNFPSFLPGFAGQRMQQLSTKDPELALAACGPGTTGTSRRGAGAYPDRIIPCQLPYFLDPEVGAKEIYAQRRARLQGGHLHRGAGACSACRRSTPGTGTRSCAACAETGTVVNLHIGSSGTSPSTADDAPPDVRRRAVLRLLPCSPAVDWLYSEDPVAFPDLKICLSEGGIGWVAGLSTGSTTC